MQSHSETSTTQTAQSRNWSQQVLLRPLHPEYGTKPKVLYIGLPKTFIMGKVVDSKSGAYLQGATVTATTSGGSPVSATVTNYGDFTIDGLASGATYTLTVTLSGYTTLTQSVNLTTDTYVGSIQLVHP